MKGRAIFLVIIMLLMVQTPYYSNDPSGELPIFGESGDSFSGNNSTPPLHVLVNNTQMDPITFTSPWSSNNSNSGSGSGVTNGTTTTIHNSGGNTSNNAYFSDVDAVVDSNDAIHISYFDHNTESLVYATDKSGSWSHQSLDSGSTNYNQETGKATSIAVDSNDNVHISYINRSSKDIMYATDSSGSWSTSAIASMNTVWPISLCPTAIAIDSNDAVHVAHSVNCGNGEKLGYTTNVNGTWVTTIVDYGTGSSILNGWKDIVIDSNDKVHIAYVNRHSSAGVNITTNQNNTWQVESIPGTSQNQGGPQYVSMAIDSNDHLHVAFAYTGNYWRLRYVHNAGGSWSSSPSSAPFSTCQNHGANECGKHTSIAIDSNDAVHISDQFVSARALRYHTNASGSWESTVYNHGGSTAQDGNGYETAIVLDSNDDVHIIHSNMTSSIHAIVETTHQGYGNTGSGSGSGSSGGSSGITYGNGSTWQVADLLPGAAGSDPGQIMEILVGDTIYFSGKSTSVEGLELWAHDTSNHSTWQAADIHSSSGSDPGQLMEMLVGDTIYFDANDGSTGTELWAHDTSNHSTWQVVDIYSGASNGYPGQYMQMLVGDTIYFSASDGSSGIELWAHDTSNHSTWQAADIHSGGPSNPGWHIQILVGDTLYFDADDGITGYELWAHDTSNHSTWQVADINSGNWDADPGWYMDDMLVGDTIYFSATGGGTGVELWAHDTSNHSTWLVADIYSGNSNSYVGNQMEILVGDTLYFSAKNLNGYELWAHDTSNHSTWQVADINSGVLSSNPGQYMQILVGDTIYFDADDGSTSVELWAHDTSNHSTWQVVDISSGGSASSPGVHMEMLVGDTIYFSADSGLTAGGRELWAHDTSNHSTWQVADIHSGGGSSNPGQYMEMLVGGTIYFSAHDGSTGAELWAHQPSEIAPLSSGSVSGISNASVIWSISPPLPTNVTIDQVDGTISGTPTQVMGETIYTVLATHSSGNSTTFEVSLMVLEDTDGDGDPDTLPSDYDTNGPTPGLVEDIDDDNDGYADVVETNTGTYSGTNDTGTDPLNPDTDGDGICDGPNDVPPICTAGPDRDPPTNVVGVIGIAIETVEPYLIFPGMTYTISPPYLPAGLVFDASTGELSGTATSTWANTTYTVHGSFSNGSSYSWQFGIEILDDTDGDGLPNELPFDYPLDGELIEDTDDDNDGLNDTTESGLNTSTTNPDTDGDGICDGPIAINNGNNGTNGVTCYAGPDPYPLDSNAPLDTDGDGLPDENDGWTGAPMADEDDDNDGYPDVSELACGSNPLNASSTPNDMDGDAICDGDDDDMDGDGIVNVNETGNVTTEGTLPDNPDTDGDGVCDGPNSPNTTFNNSDNCIPGPDDFPLDPSAWLDTDGDGYPDEVVGNSTSVPPLVEDDDDDNDGWNDTQESDCLTDSKDALDVPADLNDDGLCDVNDDDWDDDGIVNGLETNTSMYGTDPWSPDSDGDGFCDGPIAFVGLCYTGPDPYPLDPNAPIDTDGDGLPNENDGWTGPPQVDEDDDNDGTLDVVDAFPLDDGADTDTDGDGDPDTILYSNYDGQLIADEDDDDDGWNDTSEIECSSDPLDPEDVPVDDDNNGVCDILDPKSEISNDDENEEKTFDNSAILNMFSMWSCCILLLMLLLIFILIFRRRDDEERDEQFVVFEIDDEDDEDDEIDRLDEDIIISEKKAKLAELDAQLAAKEAEIDALNTTITAKVDFDTIGTATASEKDDLSKIKGIGPALQGKLNDAGIFTYKQLSKVTPEIENQIDEAIGCFPGRLSREKVFEQARELLKD